MFKEIYSFQIELIKVVEKKVTKTRKTDKGEEKFEEVTKVEEKTPLKIVLKEPTRRELETADFEYSIEMSRCIKKGILTKGMLAKKYSDTGGLLAEADAEALTKNYGKLGSLEAELTSITLKPVAKRTKKQLANIERVYGEIADVRKEIVNLESAYNNLFSHTADIKAQDKQLLWYILNIGYSQEEGCDPKPLYEGETFDEKLNDFYEKEENGNEIYALSQSKMTVLVAYWFHAANPTKEEFDALVSSIDDDE